jgi:hypothetical protein
MNRLPYNEANDIDVAIANLTISSHAIAKLADSTDNMNSDLSHLLSMMALEMRSQAKTLQETNFLLSPI